MGSLVQKGTGCYPKKGETDAGKVITKSMAQCHFSKNRIL